jgi:threonine/homoserine/homoserine lactone efflux protein
MTLATVLAFAAMAALLIMSPGPNGVLIAKTVPTSGRVQRWVKAVTGMVFVGFGLKLATWRP